MSEVRVSFLDVFRGVVASPLLPVAAGCPCCAAAVATSAVEFEVSGLPVAEVTECVARCGFAQGWAPEGQWLRLP
jgi:hypothetical protein